MSTVVWGLKKKYAREALWEVPSSLKTQTLHIARWLREFHQVDKEPLTGRSDVAFYCSCICGLKRTLLLHNEGSSEAITWGRKTVSLNCLQRFPMKIHTYFQCPNYSGNGIISYESVKWSVNQRFLVYEKRSEDSMQDLWARLKKKYFVFHWKAPNHNVSSITNYQLTSLSLPHNTPIYEKEL